jgi:hypothetical protein
MSYRYERYDERPRRGRRGLVTLVVLVWIIFIGLLLARFVARPLVTNFIESRLAERIRIHGANDTPPVAGVAELPSNGGTSVKITEEMANQWLEGHRQELKGVDDLRLHFVPGEVQADVTVAGVTSTAHAGLQVQNGKVVVTNARLDPPLGLVVDVSQFVGLIEQRLNRDLGNTGRTVTAVTIGQGQIQITAD